MNQENDYTKEAVQFEDISNENVGDIETFHHLNKASNTLVKKKSKVRKESKKNDSPLPKILEDFLKFLNNKDYHGIKYYKKRIVAFQYFLENEGENITVFYQDNKEKLLFEKIIQYEKMLTLRISKEEIKTCSATVYLRTVQLFVSFLKSKNLVRKKYVISIHLRGRGKRANQFVPKEIMIELMNAIYDHSNDISRDLAIFLIIIDTGCRPIEVSNLTMSDFDKIERTLSLECGKNERRKVKLSTEIIDVIKEYLDIRDEYIPKTEKLFSNINGNPISSSSINSIFYKINIQAFGEASYPAKAFRHAFVTNALQEYDLDRVADAIGHKDKKSTYYYQERSIQRLLDNTLNL